MKKLSFYLILFSISGFAALIYENIWTQYLKLLLGHSAHSQLLVLVVFMGGMAIGAWVCAQYSHKIKNLLKAYAVIELLLGIFGVLFYPMFVNVSHWLFETIPVLESSFSINMLTWLTAIAIILPQSILLGATFPLMSGAVLRRVPMNTGSSISLLYFTNSLGGAIGLLISGYVFVRLFGLPGTVLTAGLINAGVALIAWAVATIPEQHFKAPKPAVVVLPPKTILIFALLTGFASFFYEIGWIRMLSMVIGSSTHAFELMLSAFILGLAFGSLYAKRMMSKAKSLLKSFGYIQLLMGIAALLTLPAYNASFDLVGFLIRSIPKTQAGYFTFNSLVEGFCFLFMFPTTFFAGMTLPLMTEMLLKKGYGEKSIGRVYAFNTFGAIVGAILAQQWIMPSFGLKSVIGLGALIDLLIGFWIIFVVIKVVKRLSVIVGTVSLASLVGFLGFLDLNLSKMSSGVFRYGNLTKPEETKILFHQDGKMSTVFVVEGKDSIYISTNGKTDASVSIVDKPSRDESTQIMLSVLPWSMVPDAKNVAIIGFGSGMTTHTLLQIPSIQEVSTIEIEPAMIEGAKHFGNAVELAFKDKRSKIILEDARSFFSRSQNKYDLIISEPSNPWVSGVSDLFTEEFYKVISENLSSHGVFTQWVGLYDLSPALIASILNALEKEFHQYELYVTDDHNLLIMATKEKHLKIHSKEVFSIPGLRTSLKRIGILNESDLALHRLGNQRDLGAFFKTFRSGANSDYFPILDQNANKDRFLGNTSLGLIKLKYMPLPLLLLEGGPIDGSKITGDLDFILARSAEKGLRIYNTLVLDSKTESLDRESHLVISTIGNNFSLCQGEVGEKLWLEAFMVIMKHTIPYLTEEQSKILFGKIRPKDCFLEASPRVRNWVNLYESLIYKNYPELLQSAKIIFSEKQHDSRREYFVDQVMGSGFAVFACLKLGYIGEAKSILENCPRKIRFDLQLRFLVGLTNLALYGTTAQVEF